jgi:Protein of unknown function (DUF2934)
MAWNSTANRSLDPAPRTVAEESILENIEQARRHAEGVSEVDPELRYEMVATAAYYIAEQRGFAPGHELEDWYRAQAAIDKELPRMLSRD